MILSEAGATAAGRVGSTDVAGTAGAAPAKAQSTSCSGYSIGFV